MANGNGFVGKKAHYSTLIGACALVVTVFMAFWSGYAENKKEAEFERDKNRDRITSVETCIEGIKSDLRHIKETTDKQDEKLESILKEIRRNSNFR